MQVFFNVTVCQVNMLVIGALHVKYAQIWVYFFFHLSDFDYFWCALFTAIQAHNV